MYPMIYRNQVICFELSNSLKFIFRKPKINITKDLQFKTHYLVSIRYGECEWFKGNPKFFQNIAA